MVSAPSSASETVSSVSDRTTIVTVWPTRASTRWPSADASRVCWTGSTAGVVGAAGVAAASSRIADSRGATLAASAVRSIRTASAISRRRASIPDKPRTPVRAIAGFR